MEQQKKDTNDQELMRSMKVSKAVAAMAIPSVISSLVTVVYNMADTFFVGQTGDALQVAAVSLTNPIFILLMAIDATALPPIPNILAKAIRRIKIGFVRLTAAT